MDTDIMIEMRERLRTARGQGMRGAPAAPLSDEELGEYVAALRANEELRGLSVKSGRRFLGSVVLRVRQLLEKLLGPVLDRQSNYNTINARLVALLGERAMLAGQARTPERPTSTEPGGTVNWNPVVWPDWEPLIPPRELWAGPDVPLAHFFRWPWEYRAYLTLLCGMREDAAVLELGCSHGRTMLGLLDYLKPPGRYEGLDVMARQVAFAQSRIHRAFPNFNFTLADVYSGVYNPTGLQRAESFRFPYEDESFDIAYAASLFTHLLPTATANYFRESRRVLKKGARCLFSFFIRDHYRGKGTSRCELYEFDHAVPAHQGAFVHDGERPEQVVAYDLDLVKRLVGAAGLELEQVLPGFWSGGSKHAVNEQDLVLLRAV